MSNRISFLARFVHFVKKITGVNDFSLVRKRIKKRIGKLFYKKKYTADDLVLVLKGLGLTKGSVVCIHSSMMEFYNYVGTATELIEKILEVIDVHDGTLIMPAFPKYELMLREGYVFDIDNDPTGAGFLAETFRKYPGVERSINVQHSVCAIGKDAHWLVKDHHHCHDCWDKDSPWQRMISLEAIVVNLGMPQSYIGTFEHCVESILQYEQPYWKQFFCEEKTYHYYDGDTIKSYKEWTSDIERRTHERNILHTLNEEDLKVAMISNLNIKVFKTKNCLTKFLELGRKGITIYYIPSPKNYNFNE